MDKERRMPPIFLGYIQRLFDTNQASLLQDPESVKYILDYYCNMHHEDSHHITVAKGGKNSFLEKLLVREALRRMRGKNETERSGWRLSNKAVGAGSYGAVSLWQKDLPDGRTAKIATKDHTISIPFHRDYNNEGNAVRRLNDAGCKNVIEILDWVATDVAKFRQIFEYAEFGDYDRLYKFYLEHGLVFSEAFAWHFFNSIANALCYCRYGTNDPKFDLLAKRGWHQLYHQDMKSDNVLMTAIDNESHRLYPCPKLADFGLACSIGKIEVDSNNMERNPLQSFKTAFRQGAAINKPPESRRPTRPMRSTGLLGDIPIDKLQGSHCDIYSLGVMMADLCKPADDYINNFQRALDAATGNTRTRVISAYYSKTLKDLIRRCRAKAGKDRPDAHTLYAVTKEKMEHYRAKAYTAEEESRSKRYPGYLFHENVLFRKADQDLFRENSDFRGHFLEANLEPVWKAEGKFDLKGLMPAADEYDISIETDQHSSETRRLTPPEARVREGVPERFISTRGWELFAKQILDPAEVDLALAPSS